MDKGVIGEKAGIVWRLLNGDNRRWEFSEIKKATGMDEKELSAAIGWLVRIRFSLNLTKSMEKPICLLF